MGLVKEEDIEILNNNGSSKDNKVIEMEYIIVHGLDSEKSLSDYE